MKLLVFSDSHGNLRHMETAVEQEGPDRILHLGDVARDAQALAERFPTIPVDYVVGNCDYDPDSPTKKILQVADATIFMTHGHAYGVKAGIGRVTLAAREAGAQILVFGHTHEPLCDFFDGLWILNPGTCRGPFHPTYGVIALEEGKCQCRVAQIGKKG